MNDLAGLQGILVLQSAQDGKVDGVVVVRARGQCAVEDDLLRRDIPHAERIAQCELVLCQGAGLVRAQDVDSGQFPDGHELADNGLFPGESARADRHRDGQHGGHGHRDRGDGQHQGELQRRENRVAPDDGDRDDDRHQRHREDDEVIADLQTIAKSRLGRDLFGTIDAAFGNMSFRAQSERGDIAREREDLNRIGVALSSTPNVEALLEMILTKTREITSADAGSLYVVESVGTGYGLSGDSEMPSIQADSK